MDLVPGTPKIDAQPNLVPGVLVEVLWDVEETKQEGRRRGTRSVNSVWWRAEVMKLEQISGKWKAELRYEGREGFEEQLGQVWVFPRHIRPVGDDNTQLRWRFYECSGDVTYDMEGEEGTTNWEGKNVAACVCERSRVDAIANQLGNVIHQYETIERIIVAQNLLVTRLLGAGSTSERQCAQMISTLRHKIAMLMQRPIPPSRMRKDSNGSSMFFEENCAGILSVDVDCDYQTFASIARIVRSTIEKTSFRPCFSEMQLPGPCLEEAEIMFASFGGLSQTIGMNSLSDVMRMAVRERGNCKQLEKGTGDVAVRIIGTCLFDTEEDESAMALLACKSIHEESLSYTVDAVIRESREFDFSSRTYRKPLLPRSCTGEELLRTVFNRKLRDVASTERLPAMRKVSTQLRNFTIRWRALPPPNYRMWSRNLALSGMCTVLLKWTSLVSFSEVQTLCRK